MNWVNYLAFLIRNKKCKYLKHLIYNVLYFPKLINKMHKLKNEIIYKASSLILHQHKAESIEMQMEREFSSKSIWYLL